LLFGLIRTKPEQRDHGAIEAARRHALAAWTIADDALEGRPYLAGQELTLAEITLGTLVYRWYAFPIERPPLKNLKAWHDRMRERPAFKKHTKSRSLNGEADAAGIALPQCKVSLCRSH